MLEGHFNLLDTFLTLDGFKNCKVVAFKIKFDLNNFPQQLLEIGMKMKKLIRFSLIFFENPWTNNIIISVKFEGKSNNHYD